MLATVLSQIASVDHGISRFSLLGIRKQHLRAIHHFLACFISMLFFISQVDPPFYDVGQDPACYLVIVATEGPAVSPLDDSLQ